MDIADFEAQWDAEVVARKAAHDPLVDGGCICDTCIEDYE